MNIRLFIGLQIVFMFVGSSLFAQKHKSYERMIEAQCNEVVIALNIDDKKKENDFSVLYKKYLKEIKGNKQAHIKYYRINIDTVSNEQAETIIANNLKVDQDAIGIRKKYYKDFKRLLSAKQILLVYQTEADIMHRITMEFCKRKEQSYSSENK